MHKLAIIILSISLIACECETQKSVQGEWIQGSEEEKLQLIEKQFRGFDMAMVETGYRYQELYWAGQDQNWAYANYQVQKISKTITNGLERRPKRAKSAEYFLEVALPAMEKALTDNDTASFNTNFEMLTTNCNSCHAMENVPHFSVKKPLNRVSPIRE